MHIFKIIIYYQFTIFISVPYIEPPNYKYDVLDYSTVYLSWNAISIGYVPGILRGYQITYREYFNNQTFVVKTAPDLLQRTLTNLIPFTHYWFEIAGYTDEGLGPEKLIVLKTPPGRKFTLIVGFLGYF